VNKISLSILIPIYNKDCTVLVSDLHTQCINNIDFEILCFDDDSKNEYHLINLKLASLNGVKYERQSMNQGRSKIRNLLAQNAKFDHFLFLDCDSKITARNFIENYTNVLSTKKDLDIIYGGTSYQNELPSTDFQLHWYYGSKIEAQNAQKRNLNPWQSFKTNNFITSKKVFDHLSFDETINGYGYEDNVFALHAQKAALKITHIDNSVLHDGLEPNQNYLKKVEESIHNLKYLVGKYQLKTNLSKFGDFLIKTKVNYLLNPLSTLMIKHCKLVLFKRPYKLKYLQLYKLLLYIKGN
jgi:hypothetical protein